jgi:hypothetical protein
LLSAPKCFEYSPAALAGTGALCTDGSESKHTTTSATGARDDIRILTSWKIWIAGVISTGADWRQEFDGSGALAVSKISNVQCGEGYVGIAPGCPAERSSAGFRETTRPTALTASHRRWH